MTFYKTLFFMCVALLFGACAGVNATHSTATDATHSKYMELSRSALDTSDFPGRSINPDDVKNNIGRRNTVCGVVMSASYDARLSGRPTYLYLDEPYPRQIFTAVIWGKDRGKFGRPEITLKEKRVCVFGVIEEDKGEGRIIVRRADQLVEELD